MQTINVDITKALGFILKKDLEEIKKEIFDNQKKLHNKSGLGRDFLGWVSLPSYTTKDELNKITGTAERISEIADYVVVIGIGGSYLGAKAVIEALSDSFDHLKTDRKNPVIIYAGHNICGLFGGIDRVSER